MSVHERRLIFLRFWVFSLLAAYVACSSSGPQAGSQSHFAKCSTNADCIAQNIDAVCTAGECSPVLAATDASVDAPDATFDALGANPNDAAMPLSSCVPGPPLGPGPGAVTTVVSDLASLCSALGTLGIQCPVDRAFFLAGVPERCVPNGQFPDFYRSCGQDRIIFNASGLSVWFYFDSATGAFEGARITDPNGLLPCGAYVYLAGRVPGATTCTSVGAACSLCLGEPDECPPDISAEIPTIACYPWSPAPSDTCMCQVWDAALGLPASGEACGSPEDCAHCQDYTCWSDCTCMRDGSYRWLQGCAE